MSEVRIQFNICGDDQDCLMKCISCIQALTVPENVAIGVSSSSMAANLSDAYNELMDSAEADYKVYLIESVYIVNQDFIADLLREFERDNSIGMIGIMGDSYYSGGLFESYDIGMIGVSGDGTGYIASPDSEGGYVDVLSYHLLAMRKDIPWNHSDDSKNGGVDIRHSFEIKAEGYKLYVPKQDSPWCIFEEGGSVYERQDLLTPDYGCSYISTSHKLDQPLVSVIVPVYNAESFLSETLDSVIRQSYNNLEILVIDDASSDNSVDIIKQYQSQDERIKPFYSTENQNVCIASNECFRSANGKYIALIGHDDVWHHNKIYKQVMFMETHPETVSCFSWCDIINEDSVICSNDEGRLFFEGMRSSNRPRHQWIDQLFFKKNVLCAPSALIRKESIAGELYNIALIQTQDYELWLRLLLNGNIYVFQEILVNYRYFFRSTGNLSNNSDIGKARRLAREHQYIENRYLRDIDDESFADMFKDYLIHPEDWTPESLKCEKAFILQKKHNERYMDWFVELLYDKKCRKELKDRYEFTERDFYRLNEQG